MTQPSEIPVLATTATYTDPGQDWDGAPTRVAMSSGELAAGLFPGAGFDAESANWLLGKLAEHIKVLAPIAVDNWYTRSITLSSIASGSLGSHGPVVQHFGQRLFARTHGGVGGATGPFKYSTFEPDRDAGGDWTEAASAGSSPDNYTAPAIKSASLIVVARTDGGSFQARYTTDLGATWGNGGQIAANVLLLHYFAAVDRFIAFPEGTGDIWSAAGTAISGLGTGTWTLTSPSLTGSPDPYAVASNASECLCVYDTGEVARSTNGTSWTVSALAGWSGGVVGLAWNASHGLWCILNTAGDAWFSANGSSWSAGPAFGLTLSARSHLAALGRYWVCLAASGGPTAIWRFDTTEAVSTGFTWPAGGNNPQVFASSFGRVGAWRGDIEIAHSMKGLAL